jgi:hypothetical protein
MSNSYRVRMTYYALPTVALLALAGCSAPMSSTQLTNYLNRSYAYEPVDHFFFSYGRPAAEFKSYDGGTVYRWVSLEPAQLPRQHTMVYTSPKGNYAVVDSYDGIPQAQYCELRIYTDQQDVIQHFAVVVDSVGKWSASRCSEIFY